MLHLKISPFCHSVPDTKSSSCVRRNHFSKGGLSVRESTILSEILVKKGDLSQTSEKLWGTTVTIVKAIVAQRGKTLKTHEGTKFFLAEIAREIKDESINSVSLVAEGLHQNFYENAKHPDSVKKGAKTIKQFATRMRNRFSLN